MSKLLGILTAVLVTIGFAVAAPFTGGSLSYTIHGETLGAEYSDAGLIKIGTEDSLNFKAVLASNSVGYMGSNTAYLVTDNPSDTGRDNIVHFRQELFYDHGIDGHDTPSVFNAVSHHAGTINIANDIGVREGNVNMGTNVSLINGSNDVVSGVSMGNHTNTLASYLMEMDRITGTISFADRFGFNGSSKASESLFVFTLPK